MDETGGMDIAASPVAAISSAEGTTAAVASPVHEKDDFSTIDPCIPEDERNFYMRAYPTVDLVRERKVHCTVCKAHIGTAPAVESIIKMHPILRVTHCTKCHDFYNSGEFSKGEDGSELYCRWCGQGGEVYCCSSCPYVFCKSCITKNLSRGVVADIEQNENWNCFNCSTKILWPLRAQHWALVNYIKQQKSSIQTSNLSEAEAKRLMAEDRSSCCRLAKAKCGNMSDSLESIDSGTSRRSIHSNSSASRKAHKQPAPPGLTQASKRAKLNNDEVVCTPDFFSMLEPDCQITETPKSGRSIPPTPANSVPRIMTIQTTATPTTNYATQTSTQRASAPPPLVLRNTSIKINRTVAPQPIVRRTIVGPRTPAPAGITSPVYHTINGYRIDLNSAAQHETFRLPNGKLIQVKRQAPQQSSTQATATRAVTPANVLNPGANITWQRTSNTIQQAPLVQRPIQISQTPSSLSAGNTQYQQITITPQQQQQHPQVIRYHNTMMGNRPTTVNGAPQLQVINGTPAAPVQTQITAPTSINTARPQLIRHIFPDTPIGQARTQLQDKVFNAMEISVHLTGKLQTLTNSNAYKQARNYLEVKELYIHLSYLLTYAIGRYKGMQDKCLADMRQLGFVNDADCLENGQLAAGADYVAYGQLDDVDLFNTGSSSFHNQVYEYRKSLHANLKDGEAEPLPPLFPIGLSKKFASDDDENNDNTNDTKDFNSIKLKSEPLDDDVEEIMPDDYADDTQNDDDDGAYGSYGSSTLKDENGDDTLGFDDMANDSNYNAYNNPYVELHAFDRKLTRLIQPYPSIWCTRHPDYGNFEITRKHWRTIASHFDRNENIKLRWKNIRKRYVRIEKRMQEGKRFHGYFDKATNFLVNRDLPEEEWIEVDCGAEDGDVFEREQLDAIERKIHSYKSAGNAKKINKFNDTSGLDPLGRGSGGFGKGQITNKPIDIHPLDMKIINFVKSHPVLWTKSKDTLSNRVDEQTRTSLWAYLAKSTKVCRNGAIVALEYRRTELMDRWAHLYEMYKTFRLKSIKNEELFANLELKYSKYLAKLYFLYKIDENDLRNEQHHNCDDELLVMEPDLEDNDDDYDDVEDNADDDDNDELDNKNDNAVAAAAEDENSAADVDDNDKQSVHSAQSGKSGKCLNVKSGATDDNKENNTRMKLQDMPDDEEFARELACAVAQYEVLWNTKHEDYNDSVLRNNFWEEVEAQLQHYKHKQASDDEDNEIEIVEPKTDTITLDSDNDDDEDVQSVAGGATTDTATTVNVVYQKPGPLSHHQRVQLQQQLQQKLPKLDMAQPQATTPPPLVPVSSTTITTPSPTTSTSDSNKKSNNASPNSGDPEEYPDFMSAAQCFLASMLEVDISEGSEPSLSSQTSPATSCKSKKQPRKKTTNKPNPQLLELERQRLEEVKRSDVKLKMKCAVKLKRVEDEYPIAKKLIMEQQQPGTSRKNRTVSLPGNVDTANQYQLKKWNNRSSNTDTDIRERNSEAGDDIHLVVIADIDSNSVEGVVEISDDEKQNNSSVEDQIESECGLLKAILTDSKSTEINKNTEKSYLNPVNEISDETQSDKRTVVEQNSENSEFESLEEIGCDGKAKILQSEAANDKFTEKKSEETVMEPVAQEKEKVTDTKQQESLINTDCEISHSSSSKDTDEKETTSENDTKEKQLGNATNTITEIESFPIENKSDDNTPSLKMDEVEVPANVAIIETTPQQQLQEEHKTTNDEICTPDKSGVAYEKGKSSILDDTDEKTENLDKRNDSDKSDNEHESYMSYDLDKTDKLSSILDEVEDFDRTDNVDVLKILETTNMSCIMDATETLDTLSTSFLNKSVSADVDTNTDNCKDQNKFDSANDETVAKLTNSTDHTMDDIDPMDIETILLNSTLETNDSDIDASVMSVDDSIKRSPNKQELLDETKANAAQTTIPQIEAGIKSNQNTIETAGTAEIVEMEPLTAKESVITEETAITGGETNIDSVDNVGETTLSSALPTTTHTNNA